MRVWENTQFAHTLTQPRSHFIMKFLYHFPTKYIYIDDHHYSHAHTHKYATCVLFIIWFKYSCDFQYENFKRKLCLEEEEAEGMLTYANNIRIIVACWCGHWDWYGALILFSFHKMLRHDACHGPVCFNDLTRSRLKTTLAVDGEEH